jgi:YVTN family beta-propeller protein
MMTLPSDMSKVAWVGNASEGLLYLTSVVDDMIYIVDPRTMEMVNTVPTGDGPYEMTIVDHTMYLINFLEESIQAFDVSTPLEPVLQSVIIANVENDDENKDAE